MQKPATHANLRKKALSTAVVCASEHDILMRNQGLLFTANMAL